MKVDRRGLFKLIGTAGATGAITRFDGSAKLPEGPAPILPTVEEKALYVQPGYNSFDVVETQIWDSEEFTGVVPSHVHLFAISMGQWSHYSNRIKQESDTSMHSAGSLPMPVSFWVKEIQFVLLGVDQTRIPQYGWRFWINNKRYDSGPLWDQMKKTFPLSKGLYIPPGSNFSIQLDGPTFETTQKVMIGAVLRGLEVRAVQ